jgi:hypothetical protein
MIDALRTTAGPGSGVGVGLGVGVGAGVGAGAGLEAAGGSVEGPAGMDPPPQPASTKSAAGSIQDFIDGLRSETFPLMNGIESPVIPARARGMSESLRLMTQAVARESGIRGARIPLIGVEGSRLGA